MNEPPHSDPGPRDPDERCPDPQQPADQQVDAPSPSDSILTFLEAQTGSKLGVSLAPLPGESVAEPAGADPQAPGPGRYRILGLLGEGGVGTVHRGHDLDLGRDVAMKFLHERYRDHPAVLQRFVEEAQIGGQLQHPGVVPVYEFGVRDGRPFFAMKMVKGETLADRLAARESLEQGRSTLLAVFEQICQTMAYAHARRVVHRDLKPANVMIGNFGEVQVVDWGMGKVLGSERPALPEARRSARALPQSVVETVRSKSRGTESVAGSLMGTPAYMPPEQATGDIDRLDARTDVFALGAILCEILTGAPPYRSELGDVVRQAAGARLDDARQRLDESRADPALVTLCHECLAPAPEARPASAQQVADAVSAHRASVEDRARQAELRAIEARYRQRATLLSAVAGILALIAGGASWWWLDATQRDRHAAATARIAAAATDLAETRARAEAAGFALAPWDAALSEGEQLLRLAADVQLPPAQRAALDQELAEIIDRREAVAVAVAQRQRDAEMAARLIAARIPEDDDLRADHFPALERRRIDRTYRADFADYLGAPLEALPTEQVLASIRAGSQVRELAAALDHWGMARVRMPTGEADPAFTARLRELSALLDPGPAWRTELRGLATDPSPNPERVLDLAGRAAFEDLPAVHGLLLAQLLVQAGFDHEVVRVLDRAREQHPTDFSLAFERALALSRLEDRDPVAILGALETAHALAPDQLEVLHRSAMQYENMGAMLEAERICRRLLAQDPDPHWRYHLAYTLQLQGRADEAIALYRAVITEAPQEKLAYVNLAVLLTERGEHEAALGLFQTAVEIWPETHLEHVNMARTYGALGRYEAAVKASRRALELAPDQDMAILGLAPGLIALGKTDEAIRFLEDQIERRPDLARLHYQLGNAQSQAGQVDRSVASYRRSIALDDQDHEAHYNLGLVLQNNSRIDEAMVAFRAAIDLVPDWAQAHTNLGVQHLRISEFEAAEARFQTAIGHDPALLQPRLNLVLLDREAGNPERGLQRAQELSEQLERGDYQATAYQRQMLAGLTAQLSQSAERLPDAEALLRSENAGPESDVAAERWLFAVQIAIGRGQHHLASDTYARAFKARPELLESPGKALDAAKAAARASVTAPATEPAAVHRSRCLEWLSVHVDVCERFHDAGRIPGSTLREILVGLRSERDLAPLREPAAILRLPAPATERWKDFWHGLDARIDTLGDGR